MPLLLLGRPAAWAAATSLALLLGACTDTSPAGQAASAKALAASGEHAGAVVGLKSAIQGGVDTAELRWLLGNSLLETRDPAAAIVELKKAQDMGHPRDAVAPVLARAHLASGNAKRVVNDFPSLELTELQARVSLKVTIAEAWGVLGDLKRMNSALDEAQRLDPKHPAALTTRARVLLSTGEVEAALRILDEVIGQGRPAPVALQIKGEILAFSKGDPKAGAEAMRQALAADPDLAAAHVGLTSIFIGEGRIDDAKAQLQQMRTLLPTHPLTTYMEARLAFTQRDFKRARELSQALLRVMPDNPTALQIAGLVEGSLGALVVAQSHFAKSLQVFPDDPDTRRNLALVYLRMDQPGQALVTLNPLLEANPPDVKSITLAGHAALQQGDAAAAERYFLQASRITPADRTVQLSLAVAGLKRADTFDRSIAQLQSLAQSSSDMTADMAIISARISRREWDAAIAALDVASQKAPSLPMLAETRGRVLLAQGRLPAARSAFEAARKLDESLFSATVGLATVDVMEGKAEAGRKRLQSLVDADPRNHFAAQALASLLTRIKAPLEDRRKVLQASIDANPTEPGPRLALIDLLLENRRKREALEAAQASAASLPNDLRLLDALGRAQRVNGSFDQALITFRRASAIDPNSVLPYSRLADVHRALGQPAQAAEYMRRALEVKPESDELQGAYLATLLEAKRPKEAFVFAAELQRRQPGSAAGHVLEAAIHERLKDPEKAVVALRAGLQREPKRSDMAVRLHKLLVANGKFADADQLDQAWTRANPGDLLFAYQGAMADLTRRRLPEAERRFAEIVREFPDHLASLNNLAWVMARQNKPGAVAHARRANELLPGRPDLMDTLAMALVAEGQAAEALKVQRKAAEGLPDNTAIRLNLARVAIAAGDKGLAKAELEALAKRGKNLPQQQEVASLLRSL